jgi:hypothetical protein
MILQAGVKSGWKVPLIKIMRRNKEDEATVETTLLEYKSRISSSVSYGSHETFKPLH